MIKILKKIIQNPLIITIAFLSILVITLFTTNYFNQMKPSHEKSFEYYINPYDNKKDLKEALDNINTILEETVKDQEAYDRLIITKNIYTKLIEEDISYEVLYYSGFPTKINDRLSYIDTVSDLYMPLVLIFFIIAFYTSFVSEFDDKTFIYLYDGTNRKTNVLKRLFVSTILTILFYIFCIVLVSLMSLNLNQEITQVLVVQKNHVDIVSKTFYKWIYTYGYNLLKLMTISAITVIISLYSRKGLIVLATMFSILFMMIISSIYIPNGTFILSMGRNFNNYPFQTIYIFIISLSITLITVILSTLSIKKFMTKDLI